MTTYTQEQITKHNKSGDIWLAIRGKVYDVSAFVAEHPGGEEVIKDIAGRNATDDFENVGHSEDAVGMMKQYYVGELEGGHQVPEKTSKISKGASSAYAQQTSSASSSSSSSSGGSTNLKVFIVPLFLLLLAYMAYSTFGDK